MAIKNVIFDLGNTLVYFDFNRFFEGVARLDKHLKPRDLKKFIIEKKLDVKLNSGKLTHREYFNIIEKKFGLTIGFKDFMHLYSDIFWENTDMRMFLEQLIAEKKYKIFLLSNTDAVHIRFINKNFPFVALIKKNVYSFKIKMVKPERRVYKHIIERFGLIPEQCVFIDDNRHNILAARSIGIHSLLYKKHDTFLKQFGKVIDK